MASTAPSTSLARSSQREPVLAPVGLPVAGVKALYLRVLERGGETTAARFLKAAKLYEADLADEAETISLRRAHTALVAFVRFASRDAIAECVDALLVPENAGVWVSLLRRQPKLKDALRALAKTDTVGGLTWRTMELELNRWIGEALVSHDPVLEDDGLLARLRALMFVALLRLYGEQPKSVTMRYFRGDGSQSPRLICSVEWGSEPIVLTGLTSGAVGLLAFAGLGVVLGALDEDWSTWATRAPLLLGGASTGGALGLTVHSVRRRRLALDASRLRSKVLRRGLALQDARDAARAAMGIGSTVAGRYRIRRRIGAGAAGVIYEAVRLEDELPVALKVLRAAAAHESVASARLRREAEALGLVWHPHVVEVKDQGTLEDGSVYVVLELLTGESLASRLERTPRLEPDEVRRLGLQLCDALMAVHAAGIVHRDLKPANVFLAERADGGPETTKLLDFGIARVEWEETRITNIGAPIGTPGYMAPEQEIGGEVDARSDLFALGALLYHVLVGSLPPPTPGGLWAAGLGSGDEEAEEEGRVPYHEALAPFGKRWQAVFDKALAPLPQNRFEDAREFAAALRSTAESPDTDDATISSG